MSRIILGKLILTCERFTAPRTMPRLRAHMSAGGPLEIDAPVRKTIIEDVFF